MADFGMSALGKPVFIQAFAGSTFGGNINPAICAATSGGAPGNDVDQRSSGRGKNSLA